MVLALRVFAVLLLLQVPIYADDIVGAQAWAEQVEKTERVRLGTHLVAPRVLIKEDPSGNYVAVVGSLGSDTRHGIRYTWGYRVQKEKPKLLFQKLPVDASEWTADPEPALKGAYWIYNCLLCDMPEAGFIYKVPVLIKKQKRDYVMVADTTGPDAEIIRQEARHQLQEVLSRYKNPLPELRNMRRDVNALFPPRKHEK